jgi:hypothetical protein
MITSRLMLSDEMIDDCGEDYETREYTMAAKRSFHPSARRYFCGLMG